MSKADDLYHGNGAGAPADPHVAWAAEAAELRERLNTDGLVSDRDADAVAGRIGELEDLIATTPARTLAGVRAQVARVIVNDEPGPREIASLENALAAIDALSAAGT